MATYLMFGKFSIDAVKEISAERTKKATAVVENYGGQIKAVYALLGETDAVAIVDFPGTNEVMKASVELTKLLGISFTTAPAVTIEDFDKLIGGR
jgi:uncharacterized protein with GYD domain